VLKITFLNQMPYIEDRSGWPYYHGDCTYVEFPDGRNMLIDAGTNFAGQHLAAELIGMGVKKLDYFVVSHLHQDHTAGFVHMSNAMPVGEILLSGYGKENADAEKSVFDIAREKGISMREIRTGEHIDIGGVSIDVLFPDADAPEADASLPWNEQGALLNWYSLVFRLTYGKFTALFTGDIHEEIEKQLVERYGENLHCTLLKVPHHGNETSTSKLFTETVNPALAVVMSTGCEWIVQRKFSNRCIPLYGTFSDGTVVAESDGQELTVSCSKGSRTYNL